MWGLLGAKPSVSGSQGLREGVLVENESLAPGQRFRDPLMRAPESLQMAVITPTMTPQCGSVCNPRDVNRAGVREPGEHNKTPAPKNHLSRTPQGSQLVWDLLLGWGGQARRMPSIGLTHTRCSVNTIFHSIDFAIDCNMHHYFTFC